MNSILFSDVITEESQKRLLAIQKLGRIYLLKTKPPYLKKVRRAQIRVIVVSKIFKLIKEENLKNPRKITQETSISKMNSGDISACSVDRLKYYDPESPERLIKQRAASIINSKEELERLHTFNLKNNPDPKLDLNKENPIFSQNSIFDEDEYGIDIGAKNFKIHKQSSFHFFSSFKKSQEKRTASSSIKNFNKKIFVQQRKFSFPIFEYEKISCFILNISPIESKEEKPKKDLCIKTYFKLILVFSLFIYMWIYMMVFIQQIYTKYGNNFIKICVMPLISMLFTKLVITVNIMLFISTFLMWNFGKKVYIMKKFSIPKAIFNALVPATAANHHQSILTFRHIQEKFNF